MEDKEQIKIIEGDSSNLNISPAYDHLRDVKLDGKNSNKPKNIIIPNKEEKES